MVGIDEIRDRDSLEKWLTEWPKENGLSDKEARQVAVALAHRAAMRVLPLFWEWSHSKRARELDLTALLVLRCNHILGVAAKMPTPRINAAADVCLPGDAGHAAAADAAYGAADAAYAADAAAAVYAAADATHAAYAAADAAHAATAYSAAADAAAARYVTWRAIQTDCRVISEGMDVVPSTLWPDRDNPLAENWLSVKQHATAPEWGFWINWYQDSLDGTPKDWGLLEKIALIEPEVWDAGPGAVAEKIAEIQIAHAIPATPNAEDIRINAAGRYQATTRSTLPARTAQDARNRIGDVIRQIRKAEGANQYTALTPEADLLEDVLIRYGDNPLRLYEVCHKVARHVGAHVANGLLPDIDNLVGDVVGDLQNTADDIYNFDDEARATVDARARLRFKRLSPDQKDQVNTLAEAVADRAEPPLAQELREDARAVLAEEQPTDDTAPERYRLGSRLLRIVALGGKLLKDVTGAIVWLGGVGGGLAVLWWIISALLGL